MDDVAEQRNIAKGMLTYLGYTAAVAASGVSMPWPGRGKYYGQSD